MNKKSIIINLIASLVSISGLAQTKVSPLEVSIGLERTAVGKAAYMANHLIGQNSTGTCFANFDVFHPVQNAGWKLKSRDNQKITLADSFKFQMKSPPIEEGESIVVLIFCNIIDGTIIGSYRNLPGVSSLKLALQNSNGMSLDQLDLVREQSLFNYHVDLIMKDGSLQKMSNSHYHFSPR